MVVFSNCAENSRIVNVGEGLYHSIRNLSNERPGAIPEKVENSWPWQDAAEAVPKWDPRDNSLWQISLGLVPPIQRPLIAGRVPPRR